MVYIDDVCARGRIYTESDVFCRMTADTTEELHAVASSLGIGYRSYAPIMRVQGRETAYRIAALKDVWIERDTYLVNPRQAKRAIAAGPAIRIAAGKEPWRVGSEVSV